MIVKNEEKVLARCLDSVREAVDEIIIADTGSTDNTKILASVYTDKIFDFPWFDDFSAARNFSFSKASGDYILWLDADDILPETSRKALIDLKKTLDNKPDVVMLPYEAAFDEEGRCTLWYYRERLLKRERNFQWVGAVHEVISPVGEIRYEPIPVEHHPPVKETSDRNLRIYRGLLAKQGTLSPRDRYYFARELWDHGLTREAMDHLRLFLEDDRGWVEDRKNACLLLAACLEREGDRGGQRNALIRAMDFDEPGAGLCCALGRWYLDSGNCKTAAFWFLRAIEAPKPQNSFVYQEDYDFNPYLWLCVCWDKRGDFEAAKAWNDKAAALRPNHPSVLQNNQYFAKKSQ